MKSRKHKGQIYYELTKAEFSNLIDSAEHNNGQYYPLGNYVVRDGEGWAACDNSTGDAWTEWFKSLRGAVSFLNL